MRIVVNGRDVEIEEGTTLSDLLDRLGIERRGIAIEVNREIVPKGEYGRKRLVEGDRIEIVRMVGGG